MSGPERDFPLKAFYGSIHRTYDRVNRIFTFGRDVAWRKKAARYCLQGDPLRILDVCTGTGDFILEIARQAGEKSLTVELTGYDFSKEMLNEARKKAACRADRNGSPQIEFMEGDVGQMPFEADRFSALGITFGIRNLVYENSGAERHLQELYRVLKPGGSLVILESSKPGSRLWRLFNNIYLRFFLPYLGGLLSGNMKAYRYLAHSSRNYYSISEMGAILEKAGFEIRRSQPLFLGSVMLLVAGK